VPFSERTAQLYMRLATHKNDLDTKSATVADLTLRGAAAALVTKADELEIVRILPIGDTSTRIGTTGNREVWIAPAYPNLGHFFVTYIVNNGNMGDAIGLHRPVKREWVSVVLEAMEVDPEEMEWHDVPGGP
jgi:hypothetical protein